MNALRIHMFVCFLMLFAQTAKGKSGFEIYGDVMQIMPLAMMIYTYSTNDMQGLKEQALGAGATLLSTHIIKQGFVILSRSDESAARISQRPNQGSFDGLPSGHTSFVFSSVGFAHKRYGLRFSLPLGALATSVGISRIYAKRHTTTQVICGALLGFGLSYLLASKAPSLQVYTSTALDGSINYHISYIKNILTLLAFILTRNLYSSFEYT